MVITIIHNDFLSLARCLPLDMAKKDLNQLAKFILDNATGEVDNTNVEDNKKPEAVASGRLGGLKGGKARAEKLSSEKRKEIAAKAAKKRWSNKD